MRTQYFYVQSKKEYDQLRSVTDFGKELEAIASERFRSSSCSLSKLSKTKIMNIIRTGITEYDHKARTKQYVFSIAENSSGRYIFWQDNFSLDTMCELLEAKAAGGNPYLIMDNRGQFYTLSEACNIIAACKEPVDGIDTKAT